jgi:hypothetical protein
MEAREAIHPTTAHDREKAYRQVFSLVRRSTFRYKWVIEW